jgi:hypothetical protein
MTALITRELMVGLTDEQHHALSIAVDILGFKPSQYGRQAIVERLVRDGVLQTPLAKYQTANAKV